MPHPILELNHLPMRQDLQARFTLGPAAEVVGVNEVLQRFPIARVDLLGRIAEHHLHFMIAVDAVAIYRIVDVDHRRQDLHDLLHYALAVT